MQVKDTEWKFGLIEKKKKKRKEKKEKEKVCGSTKSIFDYERRDF